jgi:ABC-type oligopeptide transport system ATPase subunit
MQGRDRWLVEVAGLTVDYERPTPFSIRGRQVVRAVDNVSFSIAPGQTMGLVGESGCGKSSTGRALLMLKRPSAGSVRFHGVELTTMPP